MPSPKLKRLALTLSAALAAAGCSTTTGSVGTRPPQPPLLTRVACESFEPIRWSKDDTPETIVQVKGHNASWGALCQK